jgi:hypothetical protein
MLLVQPAGIKSHTLQMFSVSSLRNDDKIGTQLDVGYWLVHQNKGRRPRSMLNLSFKQSLQREEVLCNAAEWLRTDQ